MIKYKRRDSDWLTFPLIIVNFNHFFIQPAPERQSYMTNPRSVDKPYRVDIGLKVSLVPSDTTHERLSVVYSVKVAVMGFCRGKLLKICKEIFVEIKSAIVSCSVSS